MYVYIYIYIYIRVYIYMSIYIYIYMYVYVYIYMYELRPLHSIGHRDELLRRGRAFRISRSALYGGVPR